MKLLCWICCLTLWLHDSISAQEMHFYADVMVNADRAEHRTLAAERFDSLFAISLASPVSFSSYYEDLPWISIQYPEDSLWRMITWQVDEGEGQYAYYGFWQRKGGRIVKIGGKRGRISHASNQKLCLEAWRGGLVYKIITRPQLPHVHYLLTYRMTDAFTKVKTVEPIIISDEDITLGIEDHFSYKGSAFEESGIGSQLTSRLSLSYSFDTNAGFRYESTSDRWIFDHLVAVQGRAPGQGPTAVPDGSYRAFEWKNGQWEYISKLFTEINEGPINDQRPATLSNQIYTTKKKDR